MMILEKKVSTSSSTIICFSAPGLARAFLYGISPIGEISYKGTKNVPWHILATSAVVYDIFPLRASAHPAGGFLSYRKAISYTTKKDPCRHRQGLPIYSSDNRSTIASSASALLKFAGIISAAGMEIS